MSEEKELEGIGGWLLFVGFGILISPVRIITLVFPSYYEIFTTETWDVLTTPGSEAYNPLWGPLIQTEAVINFLLVIAWIAIAFLFFRKKRIFPRVYIFVLLFTMIFILVDSLAVQALLPDAQVFDSETIQEIARTVGGAAIWVPYMLVSKRVKATFVNE